MRCAVCPMPRRRARRLTVRTRVHIPLREISARRAHRDSRVQMRAAAPVSHEPLIAPTALAECVRREARAPCTEIRSKGLRRIPQARAMPLHARVLRYYTGEKRDLQSVPTDSFAALKKRSSGLSRQSLSGSPRSSEFAEASTR